MATRAFAHAAMMEKTQHASQRLLGGLLTPEQAADINLVMGAEFSKVDDLAGAFANMNRMGMSASIRRVTPIDASGRKGVTRDLRIATLGKSDDGQEVFMLNALIEESKRAFPSVAKELTARSSVAATGQAAEILGWAKTFNHLWKTQVITGLGIPNPRYWMNNIFGDFSQMWFELGAGVATTQTIANLPANVPFYGRLFQAYASDMMRRAGGKITLPPAITSLANPHLSAIFRGEKGVIRGRGGSATSFDDARKWLVEDGILDTFIHNELLAAVERVTPNWYKKTMKDWQRQLEHAAVYTQQRQRAGLYLKLLSMGFSRKQAQKKTLAALYDWRHGIAEWEARYLGRIMPFHRFWHLALGQASRVVTEPLTRPKDATAKALLGKSPAAMVSKQEKLIRYAPEFLMPEDERAYRDQEGQQDLLAKHLRPDWAPGKMPLAIWRTDEDVRREVGRATGRDTTHNMMLSSPLTLPDAWSIQGGWAELLWAIGAEHVGDTETAMAPDAKELFWKPAADFMFPWLRDPLQEYIHSVGGDSGSIPYGTKMRPTQAEALAIDHLGSWTGAQVGKNTETGKLEADTWAVKLIRSFTPIIPGYMSLANFDNPEMIAYRSELTQAKTLRERAAGTEDPAQRAKILQQAKNLEGGARGHRTKGFLYAMKGYSGLKSYAFDSESQKSYRRRDIQKQQREHLPETSAAIGDDLYMTLPIEFEEHD